MNIESVKMIPDGSGNFTRFMGMLVGKNHLGFGNRSWRYMAVINDGVIEKWWQEPVSIMKEQMTTHTLKLHQKCSGLFKKCKVKLV